MDATPQAETTSEAVAAAGGVAAEGVGPSRASTSEPVEAIQGHVEEAEKEGAKVSVADSEGVDAEKSPEEVTAAESELTVEAKAEIEKQKQKAEAEAKAAAQKAEAEAKAAAEKAEAEANAAAEAKAATEKAEAMATAKDVLQEALLSRWEEYRCYRVWQQLQERPAPATCCCPTCRCDAVRYHWKQPLYG